MGAPVHNSMGPPPAIPKGMRPPERAAPIRLVPEAVTYETGIPSGSDHTVDSEGTARA